MLSESPPVARSDNFSPESRGIISSRMLRMNPSIMKMLPFITPAVYKRQVRNGKHTEGNVARNHLCRKLGVFSEVCYVAVNAVCFKDISENIFRCGALTCSVKLLAVQILEGIYGIAVFEDIKNAESVYSRNSDFSFGFIIKD